MLPRVFYFDATNCPPIITKLQPLQLIQLINRIVYFSDLAKLKTFDAGPYRHQISGTKLVETLFFLAIDIY